MSGQSTPQRGPNSLKPMKATIPMSSLLKSTGAHTSLKVAQSPTLSPTACWSKTRTSPDHSLGQRSPGSAVHKAKSKTLGSVSNSGGNIIRRTASLDTIYLKGQWPRESYYWQIGNLQVDKSTQTDERDWLDSRKIHSITENEDKLEKIIMQKKFQRSNTQPHSPNGRPPVSPGNTMDHNCLTTNSSQTNASSLISPLTKAMPVNIPIKPLPRPTMRSSVEGLNQEIEGLVLKSGSSGSNNTDRHEDYDKICQITPEGHRAPFPEMFRHTRSVNTQTPSARDIMGSCHSSNGSQGSSPDYQQDSATGMSYPTSGGNLCNNIKLGSSPQIFLARGPPDGCEKVHLKSSSELVDRPGLDIVPGMLMMTGGAGNELLSLRDPSQAAMPQQSAFQLKQSSGSAFQLLQRPPTSSGSELN